jgi:hypothetical protein
MRLQRRQQARRGRHKCRDWSGCGSCAGGSGSCLFGRRLCAHIGGGDDLPCRTENLALSLCQTLRQLGHTRARQQTTVEHVGGTCDPARRAANEEAPLGPSRWERNWTRKQGQRRPRRRGRQTADRVVPVAGRCAPILPLPTASRQLPQGQFGQAAAHWGHIRHAQQHMQHEGQFRGGFQRMSGTDVGHKARSASGDVTADARTLLLRTAFLPHQCVSDAGLRDLLPLRQERRVRPSEGTAAPGRGRLRCVVAVAVSRCRLLH